MFAIANWTAAQHQSSSHGTTQSRTRPRFLPQLSPLRFNTPGVRTPRSRFETTERATPLHPPHTISGTSLLTYTQQPERTAALPCRAPHTTGPMSRLAGARCETGKRPGRAREDQTPSLAAVLGPRVGKLDCYSSDRPCEVTKPQVCTELNTRNRREAGLELD